VVLDDQGLTDAKGLECALLPDEFWTGGPALGDK
jgi:hypothetical protein